jgi:putative membrane protein
MNIVSKGLLSVAASLLLAGMAFAQNNPPNNENTKSAANGGVPTSDRHFMDGAAQGGMAEVELGQLAEQNAQNADVKAFAKRMVDDHSKANDQLKQLASQEGVTLPTTLSAKDQATKAKLEKLQGAAFDKAYMQDMVKDHKKDVAEFKHASTAAKTPALRDWAKQTTPTLESHLQEAEKVAPQVGVMSSKTSMGKSSNGMSTSAESH